MVITAEMIRAVFSRDAFDVFSACAQTASRMICRVTACRKRKSAFLFFILLTLTFSCDTLAQAGENFIERSQSTTFLDPNSAFQFSVTEQPGQIEVHYSIADGYYLYRERFAFAIKTDGFGFTQDNSVNNRGAANRGAATLGTAVLPDGQKKFDHTLQKNVEVYRHHLTIRIPVMHAWSPFDLAVTAQGCADQGICYPPTERVVRIAGAALTETEQSKVSTAPAIPGINRWYSQWYAQSVLQSHGFLTALGIFFVLGMTLSLLPCSLPMVPILSSLIIGERAKEGAKVTKRYTVTLSLIYVLGMAVSYAIAGVAAALIGQSLGGWLHNVWVSSLFALLLLIFSLSLLGCYRLPRLPWQRLHSTQPWQVGGKWVAVFLMGALSALIVSACMTAPLFGVLTFIAQTGSIMFGTTALFCMALGMGMPLLLIGLGAGRWLPRAGAWMENVERILGMLLAATALWLVFPVLPIAVTFILWALWLLMAALLLYVLTPPLAGLGWALVGKSIAAVCALFAFTLIIGATAGSDHLFKPLSIFAANHWVADQKDHQVQAQNNNAQNPISPSVFAPVKTIHQVTNAVKVSRQPVVLDFYAHWCASCQEMENLTLTDRRVRARLKQWHLLRADVSQNDADDQALLKHFQLYGPPAMLFFDLHGNEIPSLRIVGYQSPEVFLSTLERAADYLWPSHNKRAASSAK